MAQLYVQFDEFSWHLLVLRLGETAIGVAAVIVTVLLIVPLRPQRVLTTAVLGWFTELRALVETTLRQVEGDRAPLLPLVRNADAAYAALETTAAPLRRGTFGRNATQLTELLSVAAAARQYARSLAAELQETEAGAARGPLRAATDQLRTSLDAIEHRIRTGEPGCYIRCAALVAGVLDEVRPADSPLRHALRDLTLLDGTLARLASALQMDVSDHDTAPPPDTVADERLSRAQGAGPTS
jgi:hypothetical protein